MDKKMMSVDKMVVSILPSSSSFDKFIPLLPTARRGLERRRRKIEERELIQDTDEMMDVILPVCLERPNVYFHLSESLSKWILTIEQIDDASDLETILSSIQPYDTNYDKDDNGSLASNNNDNNDNTNSRSRSRRNSTFIYGADPEEKEEAEIKNVAAARPRSNSPVRVENADTWALLQHSKRRLTSSKASLKEDLEVFADLNLSISDFDSEEENDDDDDDDEEETVEENDDEVEEETVEENDYDMNNNQYSRRTKFEDIPSFISKSTNFVIEEEEDEDIANEQDDDDDVIEEEEDQDEDDDSVHSLDVSFTKEDPNFERKMWKLSSSTRLLSTTEIDDYFFAEDTDWKQREEEKEEESEKKRSVREEDKEVFNLLAHTRKRLSFVLPSPSMKKEEKEQATTTAAVAAAAATTANSKNDITSKLCEFYENKTADASQEEECERSEAKKQEENNNNDRRKSAIFTNLSSFFSLNDDDDSSSKKAEDKRERMRKKNDTISKSGRFLSQEQMENLASTASSSTTIEEIKMDIQFLRNGLCQVVAEKCTRHRTRDTIYTLIQQLESDIKIYNSIRHLKDQRFQKEWNNEKDLFLQLLDYLEERIVLLKQQNSSNDSSASFYEHITAKNNLPDDLHYPYANVYNEVLKQYLAHARTSSRENEQSNHYRWKRPERPTSKIHWKDVNMVEDLISTIESREVQRYNYDYSNFEAASTRVIDVLESIRRKCVKDAQRLTRIEVEEERRIQQEQEQRRAMRRFKKRNNRTRMSFAALSHEAKKQLLGANVLVDIDF